MSRENGAGAISTPATAAAFSRLRRRSEHAHPPWEPRHARKAPPIIRPGRVGATSRSRAQQSDERVLRPEGDRRLRRLRRRAFHQRLQLQRLGQWWRESSKLTHGWWDLRGIWRRVRDRPSMLRRHLRRHCVFQRHLLPGQRGLLHHGNGLLPEQLRQRNLLDQPLYRRRPGVHLGQSVLHRDLHRRHVCRTTRRKLQGARPVLRQRC